MLNTAGRARPQRIHVSTSGGQGSPLWFDRDCRRFCCFQYSKVALSALRLSVSPSSPGFGIIDGLRGLGSLTSPRSAWSWLHTPTSSFQAAAPSGPAAALSRASRACASASACSRSSWPSTWRSSSCWPASTRSAVPDAAPSRREPRAARLFRISSRCRWTSSSKTAARRAASASAARCSASPPARRSCPEPLNPGSEDGLKRRMPRMT